MMVPIPDFGTRFEERFGIKLTSVYALTDFGNVTMLQPNHPPEKFRSGGLPKPEVEVAILDEDDTPLPANVPGEICTRNRVPWSSNQGYFNMPEATLKATRNLWFHTGDRGYLDDDGYLYFVDRIKDAIRRRGENISSWEVEQVLSKHPDIVDVAVFAVRSEMSEDEVMASIVLRDGASFDPAALVDHCQNHMAYFMVPRFIEAVPQLPRTMTEKIQKYLLRAEAEKRLASIWDREKVGIKLSR
jgi:crotonobetaine/carnitine-CoA ligase